MYCKYFAAIVVLTALAVLAGAAPSSIATAVELKGNQKKQRLLVPAVQNVREKAARGPSRAMSRATGALPSEGSDGEAGVAGLPQCANAANDDHSRYVATADRCAAPPVTVIAAPAAARA